MKKVLTAIIFTVMLSIAFTNETSASFSSEIEAIRKPLEAYLMGHKTRDPKYFKIAMHTEGQLLMNRNGKYTITEFPDYLGYFKPQIAPDEDQRRRYIESIEMTGNVAVAKLVLQYPMVHFTDYMTLLKIGDDWKIINKIAVALRDPKNNMHEPVDMSAVRKPLEAYLMNDKTDDPKYAREAFHTKGKLIWMSRGKYKSLDFKDFIAGMDGKTNGDESKKKRWIESINVTGDIASAKIILDNPKVRTYDYFSLVRIDGVWKIVNKSFTFERK